MYVLSSTVQGVYGYTNLWVKFFCCLKFELLLEMCLAKLAFASLIFFQFLFTRTISFRTLTFRTFHWHCRLFLTLCRTQNVKYWSGPESSAPPWLSNKLFNSFPCCCCSRFIVHHDLNNPLVSSLEDFGARLTVFHPDLLVVSGLQMMDNYPFR